jgi:hypothetical protein
VGFGVSRLRVAEVQWVRLKISRGNSRRIFKGKAIPVTGREGP